MMPRDLIVKVSHTLFSALDVLHFALINKRHYQAVLANIKEKHNKQSQTLLALHLTTLICLGKDDCGDTAQIDIFTVLPDHRTHGNFEKWVILRQNCERLPQLVSGQSKKFLYKGQTHMSVIVEADLQIEALQIIKQYGQMQTQGHEHFWIKRGKMEDLQFMRHGKDVQFDFEGLIRTTTEYQHDVRHGCSETFENGVQLTARRAFKNGLIHGDTELYDVAHGSLYRVLSARYHYVAGNITVRELWEPTTGIRVHLRIFQGDKRRRECKGEKSWLEKLSGIGPLTRTYHEPGSSETWDNVTGVRLTAAHFKNGELHGTRTGLFSS